VSVNRFNISVTLAVGNFCLSTAQAPATCGAAIEVPEKIAKPPPGTDDVIKSPGASKFKNWALLE
jgi:hypothetical protein